MIRLLVLDVDGTLTDGGIYYDSTGNELKKFGVKDGAGLVLARTAGIRVMICTGRECEAVRRRAADRCGCRRRCSNRRGFRSGARSQRSSR